MSGSNNLPKFQLTNREGECIGIKLRGPVYQSLADTFLTSAYLSAQNLFQNFIIPLTLANTPIQSNFALTDIKTLLTQNYLNQPGSAWTIVITNQTGAPVTISLPTGFAPQTLTIPNQYLNEVTFSLGNGIINVSQYTGAQGTQGNPGQTGQTGPPGTFAAARIGLLQDGQVLNATPATGISNYVKYDQPLMNYPSDQTLFTMTTTDTTTSSNVDTININYNAIPAGTKLFFECDYQVSFQNQNTANTSNNIRTVFQVAPGNDPRDSLWGGNIQTTSLSSFFGKYTWSNTDSNPPPQLSTIVYTSDSNCVLRYAQLAIKASQYPSS